MDDQFVLPLRPKPLDDELCSSWLLRLATECGMTLYAFRRVVAPRLRLPFHDFDSSVGVQQLASIAKATMTEQIAVCQTLLRFHSLDLDEGIWLEQWLLPIGADDRSRKRQGYQYCPQCLSEGTPYFRRSWRFSFVVVCVKHCRLLMDECGRCGGPVHAFQIGLAGLERTLTPGGEPPFIRCGACGWDLRNSGAVPSFEDDQSVDLQRSLQSLIECTQKRTANGCDYLNLLRQSCDLFAKDLGTVTFEYLKARHRALVLKRAYSLLADERWRYIRSVCNTPRSPMGEVSPQRKPVASDIPLRLRYQR